MQGLARFCQKNCADGSSGGNTVRPQNETASTILSPWAR